jgi:thiamine transport system permease protein
VAVLALLVVMFYYPVGVVLARSVLPEGQASLSAFRSVLTDPFYVGVLADVVADPLAIDRHGRAVVGWARAGFPAVRLGLFGFTAYQAALSTVASVVLGLPGAYVLSRFEFPGRRTLRSLTILPFVLPGIMVAIGFFATFSRGGPVNDVLAAVGVGRVGFVGTLELVVLAHAFYNAPLVARVTTAAWESVDARMLETARSLGAGPYRATLDVVVPQLVPAVLTGALLTFLFTFMTFPIVLALGGLELATVEVWVFDRIRQLAFAEAATLATLETVVTLGLTYAYLRYEASTTGSRVAAKSLPRRRLLSRPDGSVRWALLRVGVLAYAAVVVVVFVLPTASMVVESVTVGDRFTLRHYAFLVERQTTGASYQTRPLPAIVNSLLFAGSTLLLAVPMGVVVAVLSIDRGAGRTRRWRTVLESLSLAPLAVSGIVVGVGLVQALVFGVPVPFVGQVEVVGPVAIAAAHAVAAYPFVVRSLVPLLADLDRSMVESARALGASRYHALVSVELPLVASGLLAGAAFALAISIGEFDSTVVLATGSDFYTMPVAVERYLGRRTGPAMAMGTVLLLVTAVAFAIVDRAGGQIGGRSGGL